MSRLSLLERELATPTEAEMAVIADKLDARIETLWPATQQSSAA